MVAARLVRAGVAYHAVVECDDDDEHPGQWMSIGCAPSEDDLAKRALSSLPLAR